MTTLRCADNSDSPFLRPYIPEPANVCGAVVDLVSLVLTARYDKLAVRLTRVEVVNF